LTFKDFENYDPKAKKSGQTAYKNIKNPNSDDNADFFATLRAVKKNFILTDIFAFNKKLGDTK
jgi:hypothetical protein